MPPESSNAPQQTHHTTSTPVIRGVGLLHILSLSTIYVVLVALFHLLGNSADIHIFGRSLFVWITKRWQTQSGNYSHGYLVPVVSLALAWLRRREIFAAPRAPSRTGLALIIAALLLHIGGARAYLPRLSLTAFILLCWAIPLYLYGWPTANILIFPCAFLFFCMPLTFLDSLTFPLRLFAAKVSVEALNGLGIPFQRVGTTLHSPTGISLDVADACSGLRYFLALSALAALYAHLSKLGLMRKWILFLCAVPVAVLANIIRILVIGILAETTTHELAIAVYHDASGYIVFLAAIAFLLLAARLLNIDMRKLWRRHSHSGNT